MTNGASHGSGSPVVRVAGLRKRYKKHVAVDGIDLTVNKGKIYGLIGPDGAGKSSLMKAVAGVLTYDEGIVEVLGTTVDSERAAERIKSRIGFLPQGLGLNLYQELSVEENVDFFADLHAVPRDALNERKAELLAITRLDRFRDRPMKHLSGGMKQKLGLICALIHEPELAVLDEPTTGVDPVSRREFWALLSLLQRHGQITAVVSTAYLDEASRFHRLSLFFDGRLVAGGTPEEILAIAPGTVFTFDALRQSEILAALGERAVGSEVRGSRLRLFVRGAGEEESAGMVAEALAAIGESPAALRGEAPELEDVFIALLRERKLLTEEHRFATLPTESAPLPRPGDWTGAGAAIEARSLARSFDGFRAVDGVSFTVAEGEIFGLLGANGAGKTTVIKMLVGLLRPTAGTGRVAGHEMLQASREIRERIGYMSQVFSLYGDLTVIENIRLYAGIYGLKRRETERRAEWIIAMAGLSGYEHHKTGGLPVGVRQRLALGCALVHRPRILFLDEPTSGVDPLGRRRFWDILFRLSRHEGVSVLITTHAMSEAEHCDHLALMHAGRIVADGSPGEMKRRLEAEVGRILEVSTDRPFEAVDLLRNRGIEGATLHGRRIHVPARDIRAMELQIEKALAASGVTLLSMAEQSLTMEDVFVYRVSALEKDERTAA